VIPQAGAAGSYAEILQSFTDLVRRVQHPPGRRSR
jgi:hypothetical protein